MKKVFAEGHRGVCAFYPENTLLSYEHAMDLGLDAMEFDIWLSKDKVPVLMHDQNTYRATGVDKNLRDMMYAEIQTLSPCLPQTFGDTFRGRVRIPTLRELLDLRREKQSGIMLGVEIKEYTEETVDITIALLREYGLSLTEDCWFYAFNGRIIRYLKEKYGARTMGYPDFQMQEFEKDSYAYYREIGLGLGIVKSEIFPIYREKNMPIHMFCADTEEDVKMCIEKGADLITANDPVPLMKVLGRL